MKLNMFYIHLLTRRFKVCFAIHHRNFIELCRAVYRSLTGTNIKDRSRAPANRY